jgi:calcineurin-like phosphoesterase family protein
VIGETWFSADLHLGHEKILTLGSGRPFSSIAEHDETLIQNWNDRVSRDDVVWVLGDVAMGDIGESLEACRELRGHKYLICGNHDRPFAGWRGQTPEDMALWRDCYMRVGGFRGVNTWAHFARSGLATPHVLRPSSGAPTRRVELSHFPWSADDGTPGEDRYAPWRPRPPLGQAGLLLHGHVHDAWQTRPLLGPSGRSRARQMRHLQINVGVDVHDFAPVHADTVDDLLYAAEAAARWGELQSEETR